MVSSPRQQQIHPFPPVYSSQSRLLILGTFPSVLSRANAFYYGNPHNRFWAVLAALKQEQVPDTVDLKRAFLLRHDIALWDVLASCQIQGSSDASIRDAQPNNITQLLRETAITRVFANGQAAGRLYQQFFAGSGLPAAQVLPSTSPANAAWSLERLIAAWQVLL